MRTKYRSFSSLPRLLLLGLGTALASCPAWADASQALGPPQKPAASSTSLDHHSVRLPGHVLAVLDRAQPLESQTRSLESIALTFTLKRDDERGFERYLKEVYDPASPSYHHYLSQAQ